MEEKEILTIQGVVPIKEGDKTEAQKKCEEEHDMEAGTCDSKGNFTPVIG